MTNSLCPRTKLSGGGRGLLSGPRDIFPLQPLHLETLPKRRVTQKGVSTIGLCCVIAGVWRLGGGIVAGDDREYWV